MAIAMVKNMCVCVQMCVGGEWMVEIFCVCTCVCVCTSARTCVCVRCAVRARAEHGGVCVRVAGRRVCVWRGVHLFKTYRSCCLLFSLGP